MPRVKHCHGQFPPPFPKKGQRTLPTQHYQGCPFTLTVPTAEMKEPLPGNEFETPATFGLWPHWHKT